MNSIGDDNYRHVICQPLDFEVMKLFI